MAQLTSFEEISNKIARNEFMAFNIPPELQHLASPNNKILTFIDKQGLKFNVLTNYNSQTNDIAPPILYNILVCWGMEEYTSYYLIPPQFRTQNLINKLDYLQMGTGDDTLLLDETQTNLAQFLLLRDGKENWFPSSISEIIDKVYFIQGWF